MGTLFNLFLLSLRLAFRLKWYWWVMSLGVTLLVFLFFLRIGACRTWGRVRIAAASLLTFYCNLILAYTVFSRTAVPVRQPLNLDLIGILIDRLVLHPNRRYELVLNVIMFVPIGMLQSVASGQRGCGRALASVLLFSIHIEVLQFALSRGTCELSDVFANALGAFFGYAVIVAIRNIIFNMRYAGMPRERNSL